MKIGRTHSAWALFVLFATVLCALLYLANFHPESLRLRIKLPAFFGETPPTRHTVGGTPLGLIFGSVAFLIFLFASALGIRKKQRLWPMGHVQLWLKAHIWLTILTIPLVLFHCGFRSGGTHTSALVLLYAVVMASGFFGLALQQFMPRMMKERFPREIVFERIPQLRRGLVKEAVRIERALKASLRASPESGANANAVATSAPSLAVLTTFLEKECLPYLLADRGDRRKLGDARAAADRFRMLKLNVSGEWHKTVDELQQCCHERRQMDLQTKLQHWLHAWLLLHVPTSFALLVFTAWHAWVAVRFLVW